MERKNLNVSCRENTVSFNRCYDLYPASFFTPSSSATQWERLRSSEGRMCALEREEDQACGWSSD